MRAKEVATERGAGESITAERQPGVPLEILETLEEEEQPCHLLRANSIDLDMEQGGRMYPEMNAYGWIVVTDQRVHIAVPQSTKTPSVAVAFEKIERVAFELQAPKRLELVTGGRIHAANLVDGADPEPVAAYIEAQPGFGGNILAQDESVEASEAESIDPTDPTNPTGSAPEVAPFFRGGGETSESRSEGRGDSGLDINSKSDWAVRPPSDKSTQDEPLADAPDGKRSLAASKPQETDTDVSLPEGTYAVSASASIEGAHCSFSAGSDNVAVTFEALLRWYVETVAPDVTAEEAVSVLLSNTDLIST